MAIGTSEMFIIMLMYAIPVAVVAYLIILAKRYVDAKVQQSTVFLNLNTLKESLDGIEKRLDKIENILEKVSD